MFWNQVEWLVLLNLSLRPKSLLHIGLFLQLRKLEVSPQHLNGGVVQLLASLSHLHTMTITQVARRGHDVSLRTRTVLTRTPSRVRCGGTSAPTIRAEHALSSSLKVTFPRQECAGRHRKRLLLQPFAPVQEIIYADSCCQLTMDEAEEVSQRDQHALSR